MTAPGGKRSRTRKQPFHRPHRSESGNKALRHELRSPADGEPDCPSQERCSDRVTQGKTSSTRLRHTGPRIPAVAGRDRSGARRSYLTHPNLTGVAVGQNGKVRDKSARYVARQRDTHLTVMSRPTATAHYELRERLWRPRLETADTTSKRETTEALSLSLRLSAAPSGGGLFAPCGV